VQITSPFQKITGKKALLSVFLLLSAIFLFSNLGRYALWDDETMVSLAAEGILETGDTTAVHGRNIVAYRNGLVLKNLSDRSTPPLSSYITAVSFALFGKTAWAARIPFALMGMALMTLAAFMMGKSNLTARETFVLSIGILGNTSLILFLRQCRYYAPSILLSVLIAVCYIRWRRENKGLLGMAILSVPLFAANYMGCAALFACLAVDYLLWKRREFSVQWKEIALAGMIAGLPCVAIASVWNPFTTQFGAYTQSNGLLDRITLLWWNFRDMNEAGFLIGGLVLASLLLIFIRRDIWLTRGLLALVVYTIVISIVSPQLVKQASLADIRYLAPLIPLGIVLAVATYLKLFGNRAYLCLALAFPVFCTNLASGTFIGQQGLRSVPLEFLGELISPPPEPYSPTAEWIRGNIPKGSTVWVLPDYMTYPLMFHAPDVVYAWQLNLDQKKDPQFRDLPNIHFKGKELPEYIIVFGPIVIQMRDMFQQWKMKGIDYKEIYIINTFWKDLYRPELFWRTFRPVLGYDPETESIYCFKKQN